MLWQLVADMKPVTGAGLIAYRRAQPRRPVKRRRRRQPGRVAVYAGLVVLVGLALFLVARSGVRSPAPAPATAAPAIVA